MKTIPPENREEFFQNRNEEFSALYDADIRVMSEQEIDSLTPILNAVETQEERYDILQEIAEGGEKKIVLAHDRRLDRQVAMAYALRSDTPDDHEVFLREARLTANLAHPSIIPIYNMGLNSEGLPFFTMELVATDSLKDILHHLKSGTPEYTRRYPLDTLLNIFLRISDAIAYAHSRKVLHLDIKPDNIRVGKFGEVFVCDWGLAKVMQIQDESPDFAPGELDGDILNDVTQTGILKGTPGFMAPEQTRGNDALTEQTDIFALGSLLYVILSFEIPFQGSTMNEIVEHTRAGRIQLSRYRIPDRPIPKSLFAVCRKALSADPLDRYESTTALQEEVVRYQSGYPTLAENTGMISKLSYFLHRNKRISSLLIMSLLLVAIIMGIDGTLIRKAKRLAVAEQQQAEHNMELYRKEKEETTQLNQSLKSALGSLVEQHSFWSYNSMMDVLEDNLKDTHDLSLKQGLLLKKGLSHFVMYQFQQANECFEPLSGNHRRDFRTIIDLSRKYGEYKSQDSIALSHGGLADLLNETGYMNARSEIILFYMYNRHIQQSPSTPAEEYLPLARAMLDQLNNIYTKSPPLRLSKRKEGFHLDLTNTPYINYTLKIDANRNKNVLAPFKLYSLDISHTRHTDLSELIGLNLEEVKLSGMDIPVKYLLSNLKPLKIKRLILDKGTYTNKELTRIRQHFEVILLP